MDYSHVLLSPVVTEKTTSQQAAHKYTFFVHLNANKIEVRKAVEKMYGVAVKAVNFILVLKKVRVVGRGRSITKRPARRKAVVTIDAKQLIDFNKFSKK
ncbi:50S ribosomal protein L23 [Candidatus Peregrinibacteria bacterium CG_4_10_14_0_2_um_filter_43_11]|nr:MAG: 50S ribosomal protein L23 [Candidatus Peregrinibacteria bacterium CG_4_10_14_0_2_um_filter_43_11]